MKKKYWLLLPLCASVSAEPRPLPPVIDNSTYSGGMAVAPSNNAIYEVLGRLEQLQHEVQQLRGVVEEQAQIIEDLKSRQNNIYSDLDQRIQVLSGGVANVETETSISVPTRAPDTSQIVVAPEPEQPDVQQQLPVEAEGVTVTASEKELYQNAYETLRNGHNTQAITAFKDLINLYPAGEYADNAQYWLGEAYKVNQDVESARLAFSQLLQRYPNSPKVPDALLKLGYIEFDQNNIAKARDYLTQVTVNYPGTTAAHLAAKKLMQLNQP